MIDLRGRPASVYRVFGKNSRLLYVGCTVRPAQRVPAQCDYVQWRSRRPVTAVVVESYRTWEEATAAEAQAIAGERPALNRKPGYSRLAAGREPVRVSSRTFHMGRDSKRVTQKQLDDFLEGDNQ